MATSRSVDFTFRAEFSQKPELSFQPHYSLYVDFSPKIADGFWVQLYRQLWGPEKLQCKPLPNTINNNSK